jgi:putative transcriptional regulator
MLPIVPVLVGGLALLAATGAERGTPGRRPARGMLLVAAPDLPDPRFARTVVLLLTHGTDGTMGVVVNRPTPVRLADVMPEGKGATARTDTVFLGGPVLPTGMLVLVRTAKPPSGSERIFADVHALMAGEAVRRILRSKLPPARLRAYAGHAGWAPGQLDGELARGDWYVLPAEGGLVFSEDDVWPQLVERGEGTWTRGPRWSDGIAALASSSSDLR